MPHQESVPVAKTNSADFNKLSSSLPFGQQVPLSSISGPTYVTAQLLVQQIAYKLSDKIFSYSPETFDLDIALKEWASKSEKNIHGYSTEVLPLQTRIGAGALALGYIFSPDFDVSKRHIPQSLVAPSGSLQQLRGTLDQLSLLYGVSSPFVAHVAALDYSDSKGLISNYDSALRLAEDLGLGLVASTSTYEAQHMSIFATLLATLLPTLHIYDGVRVARETLRVVDALSENGVADLYSKLSAEAGKLNTRLDTAGKVVELLKLFNDELGTVYEPFEYHGHESPDVVLVAFGSVESQVAKEVLAKLSADGAKVGVINVRIYRPFIEEAFIKAIPASARTIAVLGQVKDELAVEDEATQSALYSDVLTAVTFSGKFDTEPAVLDIKYTPAQTFTPQGLVNTLHKIFGNEGEAKKLPSLVQAQQFTFWDLDNSSALNSPSVIGNLLSKESTSNVYVNEIFDNLTQGGLVRSDLRASKKALEAPYDIDDANTIVVGDEKILQEVDVLRGLVEGGNVIVKLSNFKDDEVEKRLPLAFRKGLREKAAELFILDSSYSPAFEKNPLFSKLLLELSFLKVALPDYTPEDIAKHILAEGHPPTLEESMDAVGLCLRHFEVPSAWAEVDADFVDPNLPATIQSNSFVVHDKEEAEETFELRDWQAAAKSLAFKEAYGTKNVLRPELSVKTSTITVKENRRLTPQDYDRNIFHIEFDLGDSGLTYKIGEALGIHAENDEEEVNQFIEFYGLNPAELVQVPAREDPALLETRTVFQALVQNVDILGKPPKRFYEALAEFATDETEKQKLEALASPAGAEDLKRRTEVDTATYVDILEEFKSARPSFHDLVKIVSPAKRREYSIASAQAVTPNSVSLMIVVVDWVDPRGRTRYGHATRYLSRLPVGAKVTASVKPSVMKLPTKDTAPLIMAGLGTGLAPFRAFVQYRAMQKAQGKEIGSILLYLGSRHQREEYLYGEEWEAYLAAGVVTLIGSAFSRDQPQKIYIQDRMRQTLKEIAKAYIQDEGSFYLCGPTWPVPDVTKVLEEAIAHEAKAAGKKIDPRKEIEKLKEEGRYVLEVY
ncbi:sulfite reductase (NADPH) flavoprotein alpha-component [Fusarium oxysporum f. sp. lycopersici 4287]|uniref:assimilatory sulfite reductase (NADPH) n=3 Tax=Fusarium oxysporum TaxID=5507 RepID=A0A0J9UJ89_FUSO4|nr:sulfite reductase (NADPH) flavoprotein alpha-component [Fusarium oxysporum f. sp. lycopersici 4287]EXK34460.1 sulfite reductase (NADPH) flavoprotein alpha-component [Fusarium oxysporum f. sp. melonis 26406]KAJ9420665.1 sulfite reductase [Fusarium oxysporum]KNA99239.1 sulfite reductase (NADPH) flavoprotein alpha-component [Fusarium oxysporum f. sp. lycopersici 4287]